MDTALLPDGKITRCLEIPEVQQQEEHVNDEVSNIPYIPLSYLVCVCVCVPTRACVLFEI